ncbi:MAG: sigma-70 family RNA polymerase sigma factor, partial [Chlorobiales bacterium]|nr:sigma-70 family RNA polymerase sigma factor [Chlorobiales bacterium]
MGAAQPQHANERYKAFLNEYLKARKPLYAFVYVMTHNAADADDIFQEASSILWRKFDQFQAGTNFMAWAKQIARNLVMDLRKKRGRHPVVDLDDKTVDLLAFRYQRIQDHVEDRIEALKLCVDKLEPKDRDLVKATYEEGKPVKKIAKTAKVTVQGIYKR